MKRILPLALILTVALISAGCADKVPAYLCFWQMLDASSKSVIIQRGDIVVGQMGIGSGTQAGFIPGSGQAAYATAIQISLANDTGVNSPVSVNWTYDTSAFDIEDGTKLYQKVFIPKKTGRFVVSAAIDDTVLSIPVNVYPTIGLNVDSKWGSAAGISFGTSIATGVAASSAELYVNTATGLVTAPNGIMGVDDNIQNPYEPLMHQLLNAGANTWPIKSISHDDLCNYDAYLIAAANGRSVKLRFYNMTGDPIGQAKLIYLISGTNYHFDY